MSLIPGVHIQRKLRKGKEPIWYIYATRGGAQIFRQVGWRRPQLSIEVMRKLIAAADAQGKALSKGPETIGSLINYWQTNSPEWQNLAKSTQRTWGSVLRGIEAKWGVTPLTVWNDPRMVSKVVAWRDSRASTPRSADFGVAVLRALLEFGRLRAKVNINVAKGIPQLYRNGNRADIIWTDSDMDGFAAASRALNMGHVNDGLRLCAHTGLRRADLVSLTWDEIGETEIVKRAAKSSRGKRRTVIIPRTPALSELLAELKSRHRQPSVTTVLVNSFGLPWSGDGFGGSFIRVRDEADIVHVDADTGERRMKHIHDLRGTFCTKLILAGLTNQQAAEIMGWSPEQAAGIRRTYVDQGTVSMAIAARLSGSL